MKNQVLFDHIEVHVGEIQAYCEFLAKLFQGGKFKVISKSGSSMFKSDGFINLEVKKRKTAALPDASGFCLPCLRMENVKDFIENELGFEIKKTVENPEGKIYFFTDHEQITWHIKDYLIADKTLNW